MNPFEDRERVILYLEEHREPRGSGQDSYRLIKTKFYSLTDFNGAYKQPLHPLSVTVKMERVFGNRMPVTRIKFKSPDGRDWVGASHGNNTTAVRCRRLKEKKS